MPGTDSNPPRPTSPVRPVRRALRVTLATCLALTLTVVLSAIRGASSDTGASQVQEGRAASLTAETANGIRALAESQAQIAELKRATTTTVAPTTTTTAAPA